MVTFANTTNVKNSLIYLNDFSLLKINNNQVPTLYDIAYYLASFEVIITTPKTGDALVKEKNLIQMVQSFNNSNGVKTRFYMRIDGSTVMTPADPLDPSPTQQIYTDITLVIQNYTLSNGKKILDGIYIDYFNFPNVHADTTNPNTFRDVQLQAQNVTGLNGLYLAFTCRPNEVGQSTWITCTNLPLIINDVPSNRAVNQPLIFNSRSMLVALDLFGGDFHFTDNNINTTTGWSSKPNFYFDILMINSIVVNTYNFNMQILLAVSARTAMDYASPLFFTPANLASGVLHVSAAGSGVAQMVFSLCYWLNYQYIATSASPTYYLDETDNLINYIFAYDIGQASQYYNLRGVLKMYNQDVVKYSVSPDSEYLYCPGATTQSLQIASKELTNYIINP